MVFKEMLESLRAKLLVFARRDLDYFYGEDFVALPWRDKVWAEDFCQLIMRSFNPLSVIDVGCAIGDILAPFEKKGLTILGIDGSQCCQKHLKIKQEHFVLFDLRKKKCPVKGRFDICFCIEVAEHLEERYSDRLVRMLTQLSPMIIFTAAPPGQEGINHVNLRLHGWWVQKFNKLGYSFNALVTESLKLELAKLKGMSEIYINNLMVFQGPC